LRAHYRQTARREPLRPAQPARKHSTSPGTRREAIRSRIKAWNARRSAALSRSPRALFDRACLTSIGCPHPHTTLYGAVLRFASAGGPCLACRVPRPAGAPRRSALRTAIRTRASTLARGLARVSHRFGAIRDHEITAVGATRTIQPLRLSGARGGAPRGGAPLRRGSDGFRPSRRLHRARARGLAPGAPGAATAPRLRRRSRQSMVRNASILSRAIIGSCTSAFANGSSTTRRRSRA
jgi:hypothetical protein